MKKQDSRTSKRSGQNDFSQLGPLMKIRQIMRFAQRHTVAIERQCGVNGAQLWLMTELADTPGLRTGDLSKRLAAHQTTISNLAEELVRQELIQKTQDERDRRASVLTLTDKGKKLLKKAPAPTRGVLPQALRQLDAATLEELNSALQKLIDTMEGIDEQFGLQLLPFNLSAK